MKRQIFMMSRGLSIFFSTLINATIVHYNPVAGEVYAREHCRNYNTSVYICIVPNKQGCLQTGGTDCANFVSQCLHAGFLDEFVPFDSEMCSIAGKDEGCACVL